MTEDEPPTIPPGPADVTWPRRALARLALSEAAAELADRATDMVPTIADEWADLYEVVEQAATLVTLAETVLERAVVHVRERGASWADVGAGLNVTRQTAHERYAPALAEWEAALNEPWTSAGKFLSPRLPDGAADPDWSAARLDRWSAEHVTGGTRSLAEQRGEADQMVTAGIPRHTKLTETSSLLRQLNHLTGRGSAAIAEERELYEARKRAVVRSISGESDEQDSREGEQP